MFESVTDIETLTSLGLDKNITTQEGNLHAFDNDVEQSIGYIHLNVGMGSAKVNQKFKVCEESRLNNYDTRERFSLQIWVHRI